MLHPLKIPFLSLPFLPRSLVLWTVLISIRRAELSMREDIIACPFLHAQNDKRGLSHLSHSGRGLVRVTILPLLYKLDEDKRFTGTSVRNSQLGSRLQPLTRSPA